MEPTPVDAVVEPVAPVVVPAGSTEQVKAAFDEKRVVRAFRRAVATFMFAFIGQLGTFEFVDVDIASWKMAASAGIGALINLVYRWSEAALKEPEPVDVQGGAVLPTK